MPHNENWSSVVIYTPLVTMSDHMVDRVENPAGRVSFVVGGDFIFKIDEPLENFRSVESWGPFDRFDLNERGLSVKNIKVYLVTLLKKRKLKFVNKK